MEHRFTSTDSTYLSKLIRWGHLTKKCQKSIHDILRSCSAKTHFKKLLVDSLLPMLDSCVSAVSDELVSHSWLIETKSSESFYRILSSLLILDNHVSDLLQVLKLWSLLDECISCENVCLRSDMQSESLSFLLLSLFSSATSRYFHDSWTDFERTPYAFIKDFCVRHKELINVVCLKNFRHLKGVLRPLFHHPNKILDFGIKTRCFRQELDSWLKNRKSFGSIRLFIRRKTLFEDSFHQLSRIDFKELWKPLKITFIGEEGVDAGGLTKEWYHVLCAEIFNPNYALFVKSFDKSGVYQPNKYSFWNPDHLMYFKFIGRFVGKAIIDRCLLDAYFTRSFYKHLLGVKPSFNDLESIDPEFFKSLKWMLENDIEGALELTFSAERHDFGQRNIVDLKPGGREIIVTNDNKVEYVRLMTELRTTTEISSQIEHFLEGLHELVPTQLLEIFNEQEIELLISGLPEIDFKDLKRNVEYGGSFSFDNQTIQWFWEVVEDFDSSQKALLVQFITGTSKLPSGGFRHLTGIHGLQRIQISPGNGKDRLPSAHTCFNQLELPEYSSKDSLREKLLLAITECSQGFQFA